MKKVKQKIHFTKLFQFWGILFILGIAISISVVDIIGSYRDFDFHSEKLRTDFITNQKQIIRQEVMRVVELISHEKSQSESLTKKLIQSRTNQAASIAQNIYQQNKNIKSKTEITKLIIDALRAICFEGGSGYYFMTDFNGIELLFADKPEMEGKNLLNMQDTHGQYVVKDMIEIAQQSGEGFYQYHWTKPGRKGNDFRKISFIKQIEPLNCFIGTGLYIDDIQETIKTKLLATISRIRFGKEGYIFINRFNGDSLVGNGKQYSGSQKLWELFNKDPETMKALFAKEHTAALSPDGEFIYYTFAKFTSPDTRSPKTSFIYGVKDLQWLIGAGVYLDDVETDIALLQAELTERIKTEIFIFSLITLGIIAFFLLLFGRINQKLNKDIDLSISLLTQLISSDTPINRNQIQFSEFDQMAKNINTIVADKIQAQQKLKEEQQAFVQSEAKYRNTMDATLIGVYIIQDFLFQYVNPAMATMFGYTVEEMEGKMSPLDLVVPEQLDQVKENLIRRASGELTHSNDIKCVRRNGEVFDTMALGAAIMHEGKPASVGTMVDITERKAAEEELKKSEERANALLLAIPDLVFRVNGQGVYIDFKANPSELFVPSRDKIIGKNNQDLLPHDLANLIDRYIKDTIATEQMNTFEYQLPFPGKGLNDYEARMVKSGKNEVTSIVRNITELKKALEETDTLEKKLYQAKRMETIGLMAGGVAHDLNNILSGLVGYPELILQSLPEDSALRPQIEAIQESGNRAAAVVADLLTVARGAASTRAIHDIDSMVVEYLNSLECAKFKSLYPKVSIKCRLKAHHSNIFCSQVHIKKCLMNLVTNGIEAITGSGTVTVSTHNHLQDTNNTKQDLENGEYIVLGVRDDGPGIAKEDLEHIFEPFYSKKVMDRSGTGLGLTVVWNTVQDHNGKIFVDSNTRGTSFQLYFPVSKEKSDITRVTDAKNNFTGNGEHILIVDDEELLRNIAGEMLEHLGYDVDSVSSGEAAIEFVRKNKIDLLLIDMLMAPGINGYQTYKEIITIHPGQKAIIISGFSENKDVKATLQLGANAFLKKPYSMEQISRAVHETLAT